MKSGCKWGSQNVIHCPSCDTYQHIGKTCPKCGHDFAKTSEELKELKASRDFPHRPAKYPPKHPPKSPKKDIVIDYIERAGKDGILPSAGIILSNLEHEGHLVGRTTLNAYLNESGWTYDTSKRRWVR